MVAMKYAKNTNSLILNFLIMKKNMIKKNCYSTIFDSVFGLDWAASYVPSTDMDTFLVSADTAVLILEGLSGLASSILISSRLSVPAPLPQMPASLLLTVNLIIHYREIKHIVIKLPLHLSLNYLVSVERKLSIH